MKNFKYMKLLWIVTSIVSSLLAMNAEEKPGLLLTDRPHHLKPITPSDEAAVAAFRDAYRDQETVTPSATGSIMATAISRADATSWLPYIFSIREDIRAIAMYGMTSPTICAVKELADALADVALWTTKEDGTYQPKTGVAFGNIFPMIANDVDPRERRALLDHIVQRAKDLIDMQKPFLNNNLLPQHITFHLHPNSPDVPVLLELGFKIAGVTQDQWGTREHPNHQAWLFNADKPRLLMYLRYVGKASSATKSL
jgi:hypothetical protein